MSRTLMAALSSAAVFFGGCFFAACSAADPRDDSSAETHAGDGGSVDAGPDGVSVAKACTALAPTSCPTPALTYPDVAPIFVRDCVPCHSGAAGGPWFLGDYQDVVDWIDDVRSDLLSCEMPPADGGITMTDDDRLAVLTWIRCGAPR